MALTISDFPDEVLTIILDFASLKGPRVDCDKEIRFHPSARELALVCRRFHRLVLPIVYRTVVFPMINPEESCMLFHRTLRETPTLRPLCRHLNVYIEGSRLLFDEEHYPIWGDLFAWMPRVHTLVFNVELVPGWDTGAVAGPDDPATELVWGLLRLAGQHMPELAVFQIRGSMSRVNLRDIVKQVPFTSLEKLQVVRAGEIESGPACVEPEEYRTASFKTLELFDTKASPDTIARLIQWPKELVHFSLKFPAINDAHLSVLHSPLSCHRDTLKTVEIGFFGGRAGTLFYAADFPYLETLVLPRWMMGSPQENHGRPFLEWSPVHADLLLGPKLHTFTWLFEDDQVNNLEWHAFGDQEENWLRNFMKEAVTRKSALRKIHILFNPDMENAQPQEYPWDRMDSLQEEFEPYGLTLEYCDPPVTKSEWKVMFDEPFDPFDVSSESSSTEE